jgi:hypothetical protein
VMVCLATISSSWVQASQQGITSAFACQMSSTLPQSGDVG